VAAVAFQSVTKSYGGLRALDEVTFSAERGEVHAVLGENGAGKSTLMNTLSGSVLPDSGTVLLDGESLPLGDPAQCRGRGVQCVHQHFMLVPAFTVAENLALGRLGRLAAPHSTAGPVSQACATAERLGWTLPYDALASSLSVGEQQRVEIVRALVGGGSVLILDEPTAVLTPEEADELLRLVRRLADEGMAVLLVTHKLAETFQAADRATVLRRGRYVATFETAKTTPDEVARAMVGGEVPQVRRAAVGAGKVALRARGLEVRSDRGHLAVKGVDFEVASGEVLGVGGVDGNGQLELAEAAAGVRPPAGGTLEGTDGPVAYVPQDRGTDGIVASMSVAENLLLGQPKADWTQWGLLRTRRLRDWSRGLVGRFDVRPPDPGARAGSLSGGNQQKVVLARNLHHTPRLLVAANPTRGLDIRATAFVHSAIAQAAADGAAVLLVSTDLDELEALAHRTVFLESGRLVDRLVGGAG
jgi:simple sugar transport system ATP-binding protein